MHTENQDRWCNYGDAPSQPGMVVFAGIQITNNPPDPYTHDQMNRVALLQWAGLLEQQRE